MALTEEEKQKISEEEAYRASVKIDNTTNSKSTGISGCFKAFLMIVAVSIGLGLLIGFISPMLPKSEKTNVIKEQKELQGKINFDGDRFTLYNEDSTDWTKCSLLLNSKYRYPSDATTVRFDKNNAYPFMPGEFILNDGTRFNAYTTKPQTFSILCDEGNAVWGWK